MFFRSQATSIDLRSFDTSSEDNMFDVFEDSNVTTIYEKTASDANKYCVSGSGLSSSASVYVCNTLICNGVS